MSPGGRAESVDYLRFALARLEAGQDAGAPARQPARFNDTAALPLDLALGKGLAGGALHEIVPAQTRDGPAASGFALALALRFAAAQPDSAIVWIIEDFAAHETGAPYGPGLAAFGLDPARLVLVRAAQGAQMLWAMEEALKCRSPGAVVSELWSGARHYDLTASRRLVLGARASGTPGLILHAGAAGRAAQLSSAAQTRFEISARASPHEAAAAPGARPLPGPPAFGLRVLRARHAPGIDAARIFSLVWDRHERHFLDADETHSLTLPALSGERPHPPADPEWRSA